MSENGATRLITVVLVAAALSAVVAPAVRAAGPYQYYSLTPCRMVDTRLGYGGILISGHPRAFTARGVCGVPADAQAVVVNATIYAPGGDGWLALYPGGTSLPLVSNVNFTANDTAVANGALIPLGTSPNDLTAYLNAGGTGQSHLILDVNGYFK
jgi:hypothetical protein